MSLSLNELKYLWRHNRTAYEICILLLLFRVLIFLNENVWFSLKISLKFVPKVPINKIPALFQILAWHWTGGKPLSEQIMVSLLTHKCITWPQWVNTLRPRQNCHHFVHNIFKCIFLKENVWISLRMLWSLFLGFELTILQHWFR